MRYAQMLLLPISSLSVMGCFSSDPATPGPAPDALADTVVKPAADEPSAVAAEPEPQPVTIGPYTWAPGMFSGDPNRVDPKYVKCWAGIKAMPSPDFPNPYDNLRGPVDIAYLRDLKSAGHKLLHDDWSGRVVAVTAGATARVTVYAEENHGGESRIIEPGETLNVEEAPLGQVASLKIEYAP